MQAAAKNAPVGTTKAMQSILHQAAKSSKGGPWSELRLSSLESAVIPADSVSQC
jgi:hypothetical protein